MGHSTQVPNTPGHKSPQCACVDCDDGAPEPPGLVDGLTTSQSSETTFYNVAAVCHKGILFARTASTAVRTNYITCTQ